MKFGFQLYKEQKIDLDIAENSIFKKISQSQPHILKCIGCGCCTATCTGNQFSPTQFRKAILLLERGLNHEAFDLLKGCMLCGKCTLVCPRGINTRDIILKFNELYNQGKF